MPAVAPYLLERFQKRAVRITGPNVAPKPAHAENRAVLIPSDDNAENCDDNECDTRCEHGLLFVHFDLENAFENVLRSR